MAWACQAWVARLGPWVECPGRADRVAVMWVMAFADNNPGMTKPQTITRRVEFSDTDMAGIAHFSRFFLWMEQAEHEFLEKRGLTVVFEQDGEKHGFPRVSASCDYLKPVRYRDVLHIAVHLESIGRSSLQYRFEFWLQGDASPVAVGKVTTCHCKMTAAGMRSAPIPDWMREKLENAPNHPESHE